MTKVKYLLCIFVAIALILTIPNMSSAATEYTYSDTAQGIEWSYELDDTNNVVNLKCKTTSVTGTVTIPSTIDGKTVISLKGSYNSGAFTNCAGLTGVIIPETITTIGEEAFENCTGLKKIEMPNSVTSIGESAFAGCSGLTSVTLSQNLTKIESYGFTNCTGLKSIIIPNSVTTIEEGTFNNCSGLKEVTISENLTKINQKTFYGCSGLTSVILPESVTTIAGGYYWQGAFSNCTNLEKILIPDSVASIGENAFDSCKKLTIYGNDGMTSKEYAEANDINFKYISQWDEADVGDDVTAPTLEKLEIVHSDKFQKDSGTEYYMAAVGTQISIKATFTETIYGNTAPILTIKCGNGEAIKLSNGVITGEYIVYTYTIKQNDVGIISAVTLTGGDVKDAAGNDIKEYTCPALKTYYFGWYFVYANGSLSSNTSTDVTKPTVNTIAVTSPTTGTYKSGQKVKITVTFSENITGSTVPTLKIRFGTSEERSITKGTVSGSTIVYEYTIVDGDKGQLAVTGYAGGTIKDAAGNDATISSKTLSGYTIKANEAESIDTTEYVSFPFIIFNGEGDVEVKKYEYDGKYTMYYQFVEVSNDVMNKLNTLKEKYKNKEITYEEYFVQKNEIITKYNDSNWIKTDDGSFKKDLSNITGTKHFALWVKLVMDDKTVYEAEVYTMNGTGQATNNPDGEQTLEDSQEQDNTVAQKEYDKAGAGIGIIAGIVIVISAGAVALSKYRKLSDI